MPLTMSTSSHKLVVALMRVLSGALLLAGVAIFLVAAFIVTVGYPLRAFLDMLLLGAGMTVVGLVGVKAQGVSLMWWHK